MKRAALIREVSARLGTRRLVWFGTRGEDAESLTDLPNFDAAFSLISRHASRTSVEGLSLEDLTGRRVDLDSYDVDAHLRTYEVKELREALLRALARDSALITYRPTALSSAVAFARHDRCLHLGLFNGHQFAFEYKPWIESSLARLEIRHIPWSYVADVDQLEALRLLDEGPVMLRRSRSTGGVGLVRLDGGERLEELWPDEDEAYVSVAPFIDGGIPVNVGAVAWADGVTVHPASTQLIGISECTRRPFGYCGNDFGAVGDFETGILDEMESAVVRVGEWLRSYGYLGAFGVDFLVKDEVPLFMEVNPRFQGSTSVSCQLSVERDEACLLLEHLAAFLGVSVPETRHLRDFAGDGQALAHVVVHHLGAQPEVIDPSDLIAGCARLEEFCRADVLTAPKLVTDPDAAVARITVRDRLTGDGFHLASRWRERVATSRAGGPRPTDDITSVGAL